MTKTQKQIIEEVKKEFEKRTRYFNWQQDISNEKELIFMTNEYNRELNDIISLTLKLQREEFEKMIDDVNIELLFTDIKDKKGIKAEFSDKLIEIINFWWQGKSEELKQKLEGKT